ncbi:MAG: M48 family metallopeptidase [Acidimicrobiales bacterium]
MTTIEPAVRFPDISAQGFAHPGDRAAMAALRAIPLFDRLTKKLSEFAYEKRMRQIMLGNAVLLGEDQAPGTWALQRQCAYALDIAPCPRLYITQEPVGNGLTFGTHEPITLVSSGLVASYDDDELRSVLAHEMGHVLADHVGFSTMLQICRMVLLGVLKGQPLAGIPVLALYYSLLEWSRMAELTSDRASAIVTGDPRVQCRTLMRIAGGPVKGLNLDAFIRQATSYEEENDPFARWARFGQELQRTHPFPVRRVKELIAWVSSGDYDRIRSGDYLRRGQEPPPSAEFDRAFQHYRGRFSSVVERASSGVQTVFHKVSSWLDGNAASEGGDFGEEEEEEEEEV